MFTTLAALWPIPWFFKYRLKIENLAQCIKDCQAEPWHQYAIENRHKRPHVYVACAWLGESLDKDALLFEPGCGSGINLLWLASRGFGNIHGADISPQAVKLGHRLADQLNLALDIWQDDCLSPQKIPDHIDGLISLNWLYHLPGASLDAFLSTYEKNLSPHAKIVFDMVDSSYDKYKNNEYHTDDIHLPEAQRRPSEYPTRASQEEIRAIVEMHGFVVLRKALTPRPVPRGIWLVEKKTT